MSFEQQILNLTLISKECDMNYNAKATPVEGKNFPVVVGVEEYWVSR